MCGIFGTINKKHKQLDYQLFTTLGIANDSRGGDSCGIVVDRKVQFGVDKTKLFFDFFRNSSVLKNAKKIKFAVGHTRKASVGKVNLANAQPVAIYNEVGNLDFVLLHNGTLSNYKELAAKYIPDLDITDMTDSYVLANIIYKTGFTVLGEYIGAASLCIVDYRYENPQIFLFRGESKTWKASAKPVEERPLCVAIHSEGIVFSSIIDFLYTIPAYKQPVVGYVPANKVFNITSGFLILEQEIDRSECYQKATAAVTYYTHNYDTEYQSTYTSAYDKEYTNHIHSEDYVIKNGGRDEKPLEVVREDCLYKHEGQLLDGVYWTKKQEIYATINKHEHAGQVVYFYKGIQISSYMSAQDIESLDKRTPMEIYTKLILLCRNPIKHPTT